GPGPWVGNGRSATLRRGLKMTLVTVTGAALTLAASACGGQEADTGGGGEDTIKVGLAFDIGGRGDQSFNDSAAAGLDRAKKELNVEIEEISAKPDESDADKESRLRLMANQGHNPIIGVGFAYTAAVNKVAKDFPDTKFLVVDADGCKVEGPNVAAACFAEAEGSYLVGAAAALKSGSGKIGFIGGVNVPLIQRFQAGYEAGAKTVKPDIEILPDKYLTPTDNFNRLPDASLGNAAATGSLDVGAAGKWVIGVDSDQYNQPAVAGVKDQILTSMVKNVDVAVFDFVKSVNEDKFEAGSKIYDLKSNGVGYATSGGHVDDIKSQLE